MCCAGRAGGLCWSVEQSAAKVAEGAADSTISCINQCHIISKLRVYLGREHKLALLVAVMHVACDGWGFDMQLCYSLGFPQKALYGTSSGKVYAFATGGCGDDG